MRHVFGVVAEFADEAIGLTKLVERAARIMAGAERLGTPEPLPEAIRAGHLARQRRGRG